MQVGNYKFEKKKKKLKSKRFFEEKKDYTWQKSMYRQNLQSDWGMKLMQKKLKQL